jgi:hypothetical protein
MTGGHPSPPDGTAAVTRSLTPCLLRPSHGLATPTGGRDRPAEARLTAEHAGAIISHSGTPFAHSTLPGRLRAYPPEPAEPAQRVVGPCSLPDHRSSLLRGVQPTRTAASDTCRVPPMPCGVRRQPSGRALQPRAPVPGRSVLCAALVPGTPELSSVRRAHQPHASDGGQLQGAARTGSQRAGARTGRDGSGRRRPRSCSATWRCPGTCVRATVHS